MIMHSNRFVARFTCLICPAPSQEEVHNVIILSNLLEYIYYTRTKIGFSTFIHTNHRISFDFFS